MLKPKLLEIVPIGNNISRLIIDGFAIPPSAVIALTNVASELDLTRVQLQVDAYNKFLKENSKWQLSLKID